MSKRPSVPLADAASLGPDARRTRFLRLGLTAILVAAGVAVVLVARGPHAATASPYIPPDSNAIVVLDVSGSVEIRKLQLAYSTLTLLGRSKAHVGLVVFSGYAYEALPPGSPASAMLPIAALFHARKTTARTFGGPFVLPPNPWKAGFSEGTEISSGLVLARSLIVQNHLHHPTVVLISDLFDDSDDLANVTAVGKTYQRLGIPLRIVGLDPTVGDLQYFLKVAGPQGTLLQPKLPKQAHLQFRVGFPTALVVIAAVIALLLAVNELFCAPLRWGLVPRRAGGPTVTGERRARSRARELAGRTSVRLAVAALALALALGGALLAQDVRSWRDTLHTDAARYSASHSADEQWTAPTILPASLSGRALAVARDRRVLSALRFFALAHAIMPTDAGITPQEQQLLETSEGALARMTADPDPAVSSQAYNLIGILLFTDAKASFTPDLAAYAAAIASFQNAVRTDGHNERAKANLELILRQRETDFLRSQLASNRNQKQNGHTAGRGKGVPPLAAREGDY